MFDATLKDPSLNKNLFSTTNPKPVDYVCWDATLPPQVCSHELLLRYFATGEKTKKCVISCVGECEGESVCSFIALSL